MIGFPERLKEARICAGLSQPELAEKVGVDKSYISKLERGVESPPSRKVTLRLMDALGINDPEERNKFLIAAGVFNEEDLEGFDLVKVEDSEEKEDEKEQKRGAPLYSAAHRAIALPDTLFRTSREEFNQLITSARLNDEDEEQVFAAFIEIAKTILTLIGAQRKMRKER
jgi:transcriptional regulator with XRE-family HTH domain